MFVDSKIIYSKMKHGFFDGTIKYDLVSTPITFGIGIDIFKGKVFFNGDLISPKTGSSSIIWKHCPVLSILTYFNVGTSMRPVMVSRKSKWED
jgi:hypothetical protein